MSSQVRVQSLGRFAQAALVSGEAKVIAVFERSAYVETPAGLACIGAVGNGPLNAHCAEALPPLVTGDILNVDFEVAVTWRPRAPIAFDASLVVSSLARLRATASGQTPKEGFGSLLDPTIDKPAGVVALLRWIADPVGVPDAAAGLIGLGPGLTPSGDDLLGGALCALQAAGLRQIASRLGTWVLPIARGGTSRISYAHLACAAEGESAEAVNDAIVSIVSGELPDLLRIDAIGHTSGWDALAGVALALHAVVRSHESPLT